MDLYIQVYTRMAIHEVSTWFKDSDINELHVYSEAFESWGVTHRMAAKYHHAPHRLSARAYLSVQLSWSQHWVVQVDGSKGRCGVYAICRFTQTEDQHIVQSMMTVDG
jgi:hypothetical protein